MSSCHRNKANFFRESGNLDVVARKKPSGYAHQYRKAYELVLGTETFNRLNLNL